MTSSKIPSWILDLKWKTDCLRWMGIELTGKYQHYCPDWDYLPIDDTCGEFECCTCPKC